jgi:hypothetical protein
MRAIFDFIKDICIKIDGYWIESAGHPIIVKGVFTVREKDEIYFGRWANLSTINITIYGFYDYPTESQFSIFGIDSPEEMVVQINPEIVSEKLDGIPPIGTLLNIEGCDWLVVNRGYTHNRFIGKYRLSLQCQRYVESVTTGKNGIHTSSTIEDEE